MKYTVEQQKRISRYLYDISKNNYDTIVEELENIWKIVTYYENNFEPKLSIFAKNHNSIDYTCEVTCDFIDDKYSVDWNGFIKIYDTLTEALEAIKHTYFGKLKGFSDLMNYLNTIQNT